MAEFYLRKTDGIFRTQEEIDNYVTKGNHVPGPNEDKVPAGTPIMIEGKRPQLGDVKYLDLNDDGQITEIEVLPLCIQYQRHLHLGPWTTTIITVNLAIRYTTYPVGKDVCLQTTPTISALRRAKSHIR